MKSVAVILSGCGVFDGSEIHESVLTLLAIESEGASYQCFAPNIEQMHVVNHLTGEVDESDARNVLVESARIARGEIKDVKLLNVSDFDVLILPGGFGAAKNLSDFAVKGSGAVMNDEVLKACQAFAQSGKPACYICISPAMIPMVYPTGTQATIGTDVETASALEALGANHIQCEVTELVVDEKNKVVSTPAYMLAGSISQAATGINKAVKATLNLV